MTEEGKRSPKGFAQDERFTSEAFSSPTLSYAPVYTWMWNAPITREQTDLELDEMSRLGIRKIYILPMPKSFRPLSFPTPLEPEYLSDAYLEAYRYAVEGAHTRGMEVWLYDEGGWPSGGACGQVMLEDPTLAQEYIRLTTRYIEKGVIYLPSDEAVAAFLCGEKILPGEKARESGTLEEYIHVRTSFPAIRSADLPDITKERTANIFLSLTHEKYASALGEDLGGITALFTDEPTAPRPFPYNDEIKRLFREKFSLEIEDNLPLLCGAEPKTIEEAKLKTEFYQMLSDLFIERFMAKEKKWAHDHSLLYLGHLDKDDEANADVTSGSFGLLRALRVFDVPGVDAIRRQIFPPKGKRGNYARNGFYPILAASAASQSGGRHALSESFAVYGAGLTYDEMRYIVDFQAMCGINIFNPMLIPYGREGYMLAGELPHFTETTYPDLSIFNRYVERISYLFSIGKRVANVALYLPAADGILYGDREGLHSYERLGRALQDHHIPFDIVDDDFLIRAELEKGRLSLGRASYDTVILPDLRYLPDQTAQALTAFEDQGGCVSRGRIAGAPLPALYDTKGLLYARSETEDGVMHFLMNESGEDLSFDLPTDMGRYLITPTDGKILRAEGEAVKITLASGEIACLYDTDAEIPSDDIKQVEYTTSLTKWHYRPLEKLVIGDKMERVAVAAESVTVSLNGPAVTFSGKGEYLTHFRLKTPKGAILDLGRVSMAAEVILNGVSLGKRILPPYRYDLPADLLKEENDLVVIVTSGVAEEYARSENWSKYTTRELGNYFSEETTFLSDAEEGGLFGEVKIYIRA